MRGAHILFLKGDRMGPLISSRVWLSVPAGKAEQPCLSHLEGLAGVAGILTVH